MCWRAEDSLQEGIDHVIIVNWYTSGGYGLPCWNINLQPIAIVLLLLYRVISSEVASVSLRGSKSSIPDAFPLDSLLECSDVSASIVAAASRLWEQLFARKGKCHLYLVYDAHCTVAHPWINPLSSFLILFQENTKPPTRIVVTVSRTITAASVAAITATMLLLFPPESGWVLLMPSPIQQYGKGSSSDPVRLHSALLPSSVSLNAFHKSGQVLWTTPHSSAHRGDMVSCPVWFS